jgi:hypothetical protein
MVVPGCCTLRKMAPKPRDTADTGVVNGLAGATNLKSMPLSLNMAKVLGVVKAGNRPATEGLTSANPSLLTP